MTLFAMSVTANPRVPDPVNVETLDYAPGSPEATRVLKEIEAVRAEVRELPNVIAGERRPLAATTDVVAPHEHALTLGRIPVASPGDVHAAIDAALAARHDWSRTPWWDRAAIFLRAAELANGKFRNELL